jgi:hypothetical protein
MSSRRFLIVVSLASTSACFFLLGVFHARAGDGGDRAAYEAKFNALREEIRRWPATEGTGIGGRGGNTRTAGTTGSVDTGRSELMASIKLELQQEMGLLPLALLRERRASFVELYATDNKGKTRYGTAGYLGNGYFITVKHAVVALKDRAGDQPRIVESLKIVDRGREIPARLIDAGDADVEVHSGDWAIIRTTDLDLPALEPDFTFSFDFAEPIFRLGNDYSKGIMLATGYVGQRTANGLVTSLTDGHPGVSGGGVLDRRGHFVGIPVGRMQGDFRFAFILPVRAEMLRKVKHRG